MPAALIQILNCIFLCCWRDSLQSRLIRDEGTGLSSFPPSPNPPLSGNHWNDDDDISLLLVEGKSSSYHTSLVEAKTSISCSIEGLSLVLSLSF